MHVDHGLRDGSSGEADLVAHARHPKVVAIGEAAPIVVSADGRWLQFSAPMDGSYELWRIGIADGRLQRLRQAIGHPGDVRAGPPRGGTRHDGAHTRPAAGQSLVSR